jgi:hypothetical protein
MSQNRPIGVCHEMNDDCDDEGLCQMENLKESVDISSAWNRRNVKT